MKTQEYEQARDLQESEQKEEEVQYILTWIDPGKNKTVIMVIGTQKGFNATIAL